MQSAARPYLLKHEYGRSGLAAGSLDLRGDLNGVKTVATAGEARMTLVLEEFDRALAFTSKEPGLLDFLEAFKPTQETLTNYADDVRGFYRSRGIEMPEAEVYLVDELPRPYDQKGFSALTTDEGDRKRYGLAPGIYCLPTAVVPILIEYMIAHEFIHVWLGSISPDDPCTILEEGLGEYLSVFGYMADRYGRRTSGAFYQYYRLNSASGSRYDTYVDGLRQIIGIIGATGYTNLMQAAKQGRSTFNLLLPGFVDGAPSHTAPGQMRRGSLLDEPIAEDYYDAVNTAVVFPRSLIVSAEAFLAARVAQDGMTIREVAKACSMTEELAMRAITELDGRAFVTLRTDGRAVSRNLATAHLQIGHFRYDFR